MTRPRALNSPHLSDDPANGGCSLSSCAPKTAGLYRPVFRSPKSQVLLDWVTASEQKHRAYRDGKSVSGLRFRFRAAHQKKACHLQYADSKPFWLLKSNSPTRLSSSRPRQPWEPPQRESLPSFRPSSPSSRPRAAHRSGRPPGTRPTWSAPCGPDPRWSQ